MSPRLQACGRLQSFRVITRIRYHRLPHWEHDGSTYFITWRLERTQQALSQNERTIVMSVLRHFDEQRFRLHALVVMDDHVHLVVTPFPGWRLGQLLHTWKSYSSFLLQRTTGRRGPVWQIDSYDRIVRTASELAEKIRYIRRNPFLRWPELAEYPWLWWSNTPYDGGRSGLRA